MSKSRSIPCHGPRDEDFAALEGNNGDKIACLILVVDNFAHVNQATAEIETRHEKSCRIFERIQETGLSNDEVGAMATTSEEGIEHLDACNCNVRIEALFRREDGDTLLVPLTLSEVKSKVPGLNDEDTTKEMLETAKELGAVSRLLQDMKPLFENVLCSNAPPPVPGSGVRA